MSEISKFGWVGDCRLRDFLTYMREDGPEAGLGLSDELLELLDDTSTN